MKLHNNHPQPLTTPIYLKTDDKMDWPQDNAFYVLSKDGLFLCRNHQFFMSCVPSDRWPAELAGQRPFLEIDYPRLPRRLLERVVGFFDIIGERYDSEAAVLLVWNRKSQKVEVVVPEQTGTVGTTYYGSRHPLDLHYEIPPLSAPRMLIGDIHSHVDGAAYASWTDRADEAYRPGLHLVVGRIKDEPPEFYCAVTADGMRFRVNDLDLVMEDYRARRRDDVPEEWIAKVKVEEWSSSKPRTGCSSGNPRNEPLPPGNCRSEEATASRRDSSQMSGRDAPCPESFRGAPRVQADRPVLRSRATAEGGQVGPTTVLGKERAHG
jgi:proteasome lid subunit RPN8/RPN11